MDERLARNIGNIRSLEALSQFEANVRAKHALTPEISAAIKARSGELGCKLIAERTGLDLTELSPAEEKVVQAISVYAAVKKREGSNANRTLNQIKGYGLLGAAERAVARAKPTMGFATLAEADQLGLTYEQIVIDHAEEFSPRALWFARRALDLPNESEKPPATAVTPVQSRTKALLRWLRERSLENGGPLPVHTNAEAAAVLGMDDMHRQGRVFGNIQSRIDYACYLRGLPPLGLTAKAPFDRAWQREGRSWNFPVPAMQAAAQARRWRSQDFDAVLQETERLPGQAHLPWRKELRDHETRVRRWAYGLADQTAEAGERTDEAQNSADAADPLRRNLIWSRNELILALDLYLRHRDALPGRESAEVVELSEFLGRFSRARGNTNTATYRNANGVYMKMNNFRRFDPAYLAEGKVGLRRGNKEEGTVWAEFSADPAALAAAVGRIRQSLSQKALSFAAAPAPGEPPYWVFVCNPRKWAFDRFLDRSIEFDTWGVRPSDRKKFAPGQLSIVRVGVDNRTVAERKGAPPLEAGIYAVCMVESEAFAGTGASDEFWGEGQGRAPGWPTVRLRYLRTYASQPLTIAALRAKAPKLSPLLLHGFQAASFPIPASDFHTVMALLGESLENVPLVAQPTLANPDELAALEQKYHDASPDVKERVSRTIERGPVGAAVKRANGFRCQLCEALGRNPIGFKKADGEPYVEAHHVTHVATKAMGSLAASNVMTLCANHHREVHYGGIVIEPFAEAFEVQINGQIFTVPRCIISIEAT
jgi:predicted HNH restriction endonuclease